jgi:hypothetical protein
MRAIGNLLHRRHYHTEVFEFKAGNQALISTSVRASVQSSDLFAQCGVTMAQEVNCTSRLITNPRRSYRVFQRCFKAPGVAKIALLAGTVPK